MKILFLDVDGVLNSAKSPQPTHELYPVDPYMALLVDRIIQATGCEVVLSSTWRNHPTGRAAVEKSIPLIGQTPYLGTIRGEEIKDWLDNKHAENGYAVTKYAILDDDSDMLPKQLPNFFQTTWETGLTEEIANKVIEHLNS